MNGGLKDSFEVFTKMRSDRTKWRDRYMGNLFLNCGYETKGGHWAELDLRSMLNLIEVADYCHSVPSYAWHVITAQVSCDAEGHLDNDCRRFVEANIPKYLDALKNRMMYIPTPDGKMKKRKNLRNKVLYRWHIEDSQDRGYHAHVAFFIAGHSFLNGGYSALVEAIKALKNNDEFSLFNTDINKWNESRMQDKEAIHYFRHRGYTLGDQSLSALPLKTIEDYRYALYVVSYQTKTWTKEDVFEKGRRWSGGSQIPKRTSANEPLIYMAA